MHKRAFVCTRQSPTTQLARRPSTPPAADKVAATPYCRGVATGASGLAQTVCKATLVHVCAHTSTPRHIGVLRLLLKHRYWKKVKDKHKQIGHQTT